MYGCLIRAGLLGLTLATLSSLAGAQESTAKLEKALERLQNAPNFVVQGQASKKDTPSNGMTMVIGGMGGGAGQPFEGDFEVWKRTDETVVCSKKKIPGFVIYQGQGRNVAQTTFEKTPFELGNLEVDLSVLLDFEKLLKEISKAEVKSREEKSTGQRHFLVSLPGSLMPKESGPMAQLQPRVLRIEATFSLDPAGRLAQTVFEVVRSDPMAGLQQRALGGSSGGSVSFSTSDLSGLDDSSEGARWIYELDFTKADPSKRTERARKAIASLLLPDEF